MEDKRPFLIKIINKLYRYTQFYTDNVLQKFQLSSGTYPYLLILYENEGISQNQISKELNVDKAMSARTIRRLIELNYIKKEEDAEDCRAYRLYLTDKSRAIIPQIINEIDNWIYLISKDSNLGEQELAVEFLSKALNNAKNYKSQFEEREAEVWRE